LVGVSITLLAGTFVSPALAQSTEDLATARSLAVEANKKKVGDPKGAIDLFGRAFSLAPSPSVRLETGRLHLALNELIEAEADFREAMTVSKKNEPPAWKTARTAAADELAKVEGRAGFVVITVPAEAKATAKVFIDGKPVPPAAIGVRRAVNPGSHAITAEAPGFKPTRRDVALKEKQVVDVPLTFEVDPAATPVIVPPVSTTPPAASSAPAPAETSPPPPPAAPAPAADTIVGRTGYGLAIGGFTTGGVLMGLGAVSGLLAKKTFDDFKGLCVQKHCPPDKKSEGSTATVYAAISTGGFAVGGAFLVVGVVGLFTGGRPIYAGRTSLVPTTDGRQLCLQGSF
jgi:hypothetical protein